MYTTLKYFLNLKKISFEKTAEKLLKKILFKQSSFQSQIVKVDTHPKKHKRKNFISYDKN